MHIYEATLQRLSTLDDTKINSQSSFPFPYAFWLLSRFSPPYTRLEVCLTSRYTQMIKVELL